MNVQAVDRALEILEFVGAEMAVKGPVSAKRIAERLGVSVTAAHNIVRTLANRGYLSQASDRRYRLGLRCEQLDRNAKIARLRTADGIVLALAEQTGESVSLAALMGGKRRALFESRGTRLISVNPSAESGHNLFQFVTGRVLAAYASRQEFEEIIERNDPPGDVWDGIADAAKLMERLAAIRKAGRACKRTPEVAAVAMPVCDEDSRIVAALGVYWPATRDSEARLREIREFLRAAVERIEEELRTGNQEGQASRG